MTLNKKVLMDPMKKITLIRYKLFSKENIKKHCIIFVKEYTHIIYTITKQLQPMNLQMKNTEKN